MKLMFDRKGLTRYEIIMMSGLLFLITAVVVPEISRSMLDTKLCRLENELRQIKRALNSCRADLGCYPAEAESAVDPGLLSSRPVPPSYREFWGGPYLDKWPAGHPWGGTYRYEHGRYLLFDYDAAAGNEAYITGKGGLDSKILQKIDSRLDDGSPRTGRVRFDKANTLRFYVGEGRCWEQCADSEMDM